MCQKKTHGMYHCLSLKCLPFGILSFKYFAYLVYFEWLHYRTGGKFSNGTGKICFGKHLRFRIVRVPHFNLFNGRRK